MSCIEDDDAEYKCHEKDLPWNSIVFGSRSNIPYCMTGAYRKARLEIGRGKYDKDYLHQFVYPTIKKFVKDELKASGKEEREFKLAFFERRSLGDLDWKFVKLKGDELDMRVCIDLYKLYVKKNDNVAKTKKVA